MEGSIRFNSRCHSKLCNRGNRCLTWQGHLRTLLLMRNAASVRNATSAWWKSAGFIVWALAAAVIARKLNLRLEDFTIENVKTTILSFGWWSPAVYVLAFGQPIVPLPGSVMAMAAGLAYGLVPGLALSVVAATIRGCGQFVMARALGREAVERTLHGRWASLDKYLGSHGFWAVFWFRIVPSVPFDAQNLLLGVSKIPFSIYALATFLALVPGLLIWVYLGKSIHSWAQFGLVALGLLLIIGARFIFSAIKRRRAA